MSKMSSFEIYNMLFRQAKAGNIKVVPEMTSVMVKNVTRRIDEYMDRVNLFYENNRITDDEFTEKMKVAERMLNAI